MIRAARWLLRFLARQNYRAAAVVGAAAGWHWGRYPLGALGLFVLPLLLACWSPGLLVPRSWRKRWRARPYLDEHGRLARRPRPPLRHGVEAACLARGRCAFCHARRKRLWRPGGVSLAADHLCPYAEGGSMSLLNLGALCRRCNGRKLDYWPGRVIPFTRKWRPARGAGRILAAEQAARWNPLRWALAWVALIA